ncbi:phosphoglycerate mutase-like protein [Triticum dicoccoides]|uniref:phosphoglycerate mutase-like protein n=1 Tax=Triticum dicoccoides TaxID=85692 RepID=UPI00189001EA|nr:phosphoglycerate mutase-like protein [Triticum dicoccoides]
MEASARTALYPQHRCKNIYLVRHAQGIHNVAGDKDHSAYMSPTLLDAHITPLGWSQIDCLREHVSECGLAKKVDLVIVSPLLIFLTIQTAVGVFGGNYTDGVSASSSMVEGVGHGGRQAITSLKCPPFLAVEACRERLGVHSCDKRSSITKYRTLFPTIDFSLIENDEDVLWEPDVRESNESVAARGMKFIDCWPEMDNDISSCNKEGYELRKQFLSYLLNHRGNEAKGNLPDIVKEFFKRIV